MAKTVQQLEAELKKANSRIETLAKENERVAELEKANAELEKSASEAQKQLDAIEANAKSEANKEAKKSVEQRYMEAKKSLANLEREVGAKRIKDAGLYDPVTPKQRREVLRRQRQKIKQIRVSDALKKTPELLEVLDGESNDSQEGKSED